MKHYINVHCARSEKGFATRAHNTWTNVGRDSDSGCPLRHFRASYQPSFLFISENRSARHDDKQRINSFQLDAAVMHTFNRAIAMPHLTRANIVDTHVILITNFH